MTSFRVEVTGTWHDALSGSMLASTQVFVVAAPGQRAAEVAAAQLFGGAAALKRCRALPERSVRVLVDPDVGAV